MARYIDADKFVERLKVSPAFPNMGMDGYFLRDVVINILGNMPTADVAPKSEVERWRRNLEAVLEERAEERAEIAREIIADMRELIKGYENIDVYLDRIEKKYTEGEQNEN